MFDPDTQTTIGNDIFYPFWYLKQSGHERGISISTIDTEPLDSYDAIIFMDFPGYNNKFLKEVMFHDNLYLFLFENEVVKPDNYDPLNYTHFKKIYSYNDKLVDNNRIFKFFLPNKIPGSISFKPEQKTKFCCMILSNKHKTHPLELYSERLRAINWFETNHQSAFDFYGQGWGLTLPMKINQLKTVIQPVYNLFVSRHQSYRGTVQSKLDVLRNYKFSICYENASIPGYISEKIFDCFLAGCVPVYLGAPNITDYIPENTFIDERDFPDYAQLFKYLKNMPDEEYNGYLTAIERFITSEKIVPFSAEHFTKTIFSAVGVE